MTLVVVSWLGRIDPIAMEVFGDRMAIVSDEGEARIADLL